MRPCSAPRSRRSGQGDRANGRTLLRQATDQEPDNGLAWLWLANATDDPREAVGCLRRVLGIDPHNGHARVALVRAGAAASKAGDKAQARGWLAEATELAPANEAGWCSGPGWRRPRRRGSSACRRCSP